MYRRGALDARTILKKRRKFEASTFNADLAKITNDQSEEGFLGKSISGIGLESSLHPD